jgi:hypothetical protein
VSPIDDALREELSALLDDALPAERAAELRRRIDADPALKREYEELARAVGAVRALPRAGAPAALRARLDDSLKGRAPGRIFRLGWLAAAAASVALVTALTLHFRGGARPTELEARQDPPAAPVAEEADVRSRATGQAKAPEADADRFGDSQQALEAAPPQEPLQKEKVMLRGRGSPRAKDADEAKREEPPVDLVRAVETAKKVGAGERKEYLRQLNALEAKEARRHILRLFPHEIDAGKARQLKLARRDAAPVVLEAILLEDRDEASLVTKILGNAAPALGGLAVQQPPRDRVAVADVEGTPEDLARIARWLTLLDVSKEGASRPRVNALQDEASAEAAEAGPKVRAVVELRYKPPPPPAPAPGK